MKLVLAAIALVACSPGGRGALEPVAGSGVTLASTHGLPNDTARLDAAGVRADVTGAWSKTGPSFEIVYRAGNAPVAIAMSTRVRWNGRSVAASATWDRTVPVPGSNMGRQLFKTDSLRIPANGRRTVLIFTTRRREPNRPAMAIR